MATVTELRTTETIAESGLGRKSEVRIYRAYDATTATIWNETFPRNVDPTLGARHPTDPNLFVANRDARVESDAHAKFIRATITFQTEQLDTDVLYVETDITTSQEQVYTDKNNEPIYVEGKLTLVPKLSPRTTVRITRPRASVSPTILRTIAGYVGNNINALPLLSADPSDAQEYLLVGYDMEFIGFAQGEFREITTFLYDKNKWIKDIPYRDETGEIVGVKSVQLYEPVSWNLYLFGTAAPWQRTNLSI